MTNNQKILENEYKKLYGTGYELISKMEGFSIGKAVGKSKDGIIKPVEGKKVKFIGDRGREVGELVNNQNRGMGKSKTKKLDVLVESQIDKEDQEKDREKIIWNGLISKWKRILAEDPKSIIEEDNAYDEELKLEEVELITQNDEKLTRELGIKKQTETTLGFNVDLIRKLNSRSMVELYNEESHWIKNKLQFANSQIQNIELKLDLLAHESVKINTISKEIEKKQTLFSNFNKKFMSIINSKKKKINLEDVRNIINLMKEYSKTSTFFSIENFYLTSLKQIIQEYTIKNNFFKNLKIESILIDTDEYLNSFIKPLEEKSFPISTFTDKKFKQIPINQKFINETLSDGTINDKFFGNRSFKEFNQTFETKLIEEKANISGLQIKYKLKYFKQKVILKNLEYLVSHQSTLYDFDSLLKMLKIIFCLEIFDNCSLMDKFFAKFFEPEFFRKINSFKFGDQLLIQTNEIWDVICLINSERLFKKISLVLSEKIFRKLSKNKNQFKKEETWEQLVKFFNFLTSRDRKYIIYMVLFPRLMYYLTEEKFIGNKYQYQIIENIVKYQSFFLNKQEYSNFLKERIKICISRNILYEQDKNKKTKTNWYLLKV